MTSDRAKFLRVVREQRAGERVAQCREKWRRGLLSPARISVVLDARGLYGPEVDEMCGVREPEVDQWEAGLLYPTWGQVQKLADLCGTTVEFLFPDPEFDDLQLAESSSLRFHVPPREWAALPRLVHRFTPEAVAATVAGQS